MPVTRLMYHIVFATKYRSPVLTEARRRRIEVALRRSFDEREPFVRLVAFGAWVDHVHLVVEASPVEALAAIVHNAKATTRFALRQWKGGLEQRTLWQRGYWAATVNPNDHQCLIRYVRAQELHHREGGLVAHLEFPGRHMEA